MEAEALSFDKTGAVLTYEKFADTYKGLRAKYVQLRYWSFKWSDDVIAENGGLTEFEQDFIDAFYLVL